MFYFLFRIAFFLLLFRATKALRVSLLLNYLLVSVLILGEMIFLSFGHQLTVHNDFTFWLSLFMLAMGGVLGTGALPVFFKQFKIKWAQFYKNLDFFNILLIVLILTILVATLALALFSAPNNHDAMTALLARLMFWVENKSVEFYATSELPQLGLGPYASYKFLTHFFVTGNDVLVQLVQWEAMVMALVAVSLMATKLKLKLWQELFTIFLTVTIPMGILQASSAQNDYLVTSYVVAAFYLCFDFFLTKKITLINAVLIGVAIGLALLAKATAFIYLLGLGIWVGIELLRYRNQFWRKIFTFLLIPLIVMAINFFQFTQSYQTFGHPLGAFNENEFTYINRTISANSFFANVVRNMLVHFSVQNLYWNNRINTFIYEISTAINFDLNDPANTWDVRVPFQIQARVGDENYSGNPWHLVLILSSLVVLFITFFQKKKKEGGYWSVLIIPVSLSFLFFCLLLKWQPWHARLQLPYFILFSPLVALALQFQKRTTALVVSTLLVAILSTSAFVNLVNNNNKHIGNGSLFVLSRERMYFVSGRHFGYDTLLPLSDKIQERSCDVVHLAFATNEYEYPLWALTHFQLHFDHVFVRNQSHLFSKETVLPGKNCYVVSRARGDYYEIIDNSVNQFTPKFDFGRFTLVE